MRRPDFDNYFRAILEQGLLTWRGYAKSIFYHVAILPNSILLTFRYYLTHFFERPHQRSLKVSRDLLYLLSLLGPDHHGSSEEWGWLR